VREGFDCVVRVGKLNDSSLVARVIGEYQLINCVSPSYITAHGIPQSLDDLAQHKLVHYVSVLGAKSDGFEYVDELTSTIKYIPMEGALIVNNAEAYLSACLAGLGIIQVPENGATARPYIDNGQLIEILPSYRSAPMPVSLLYANRRHLPKRVQAFMNWMIEIIKPTVSNI
jgi:DNA-binding transcriptional LysR family regulator